MKILLLEHPRQIASCRCNDIANTPLASSLITGSVAGMLQSRGHQISIVEGFLDGLNYNDIYEKVVSFKPAVMGVHMVYNWEDNQQLYTFIRRLKSKGLVDKIVGYGYYPTFACQEILAFCPEFDGLLVGEPEQTFAEWLETGKPVAGMAWRDSRGGINMLRREPIADLDALPDPVRTEAMMRMGEVNIEGSRGCYGRCVFCYINPYYGDDSRWRPKSPERIIREIDSIIDKYGSKKFYFTDPNFFGPGQMGQRRSLKLAALLKDRNICFGIEGRVNDIHQQTISALVEAGLEQILVGLESGRDESLKRLNKLTTVAQNERALQILRQNGIEPNVGFIMFEPDSSLADIRTNFEFLRRNDLLKNIFITANVLYHPQIVLQGTPAYRNLQQQGRLNLKATTYESETDFKVPEVARLSAIMARVTNYFFVKVDEVWQGRLTEPANAADLYQAINQLLVGCFEKSLSRLEAGDAMDDTAAAEAIDKVKAEIGAVFEQFIRNEDGCGLSAAPGKGCA
ncbi:radical SAM superfamily enzyme YgiQ (UPF0313 family) [Desulfosalsimonas propionicica]|uniref:Radical SAM superfamily enzyme YgiQ (UPF0313 family) n=1 Tax=Desulfosalsimonas propionicica TaxID=332175 RepID=A0A7W0CAC4_9BACT|nr:radical SAM protein [Desulfosalsimonas propionicica]MBA2882067.1 radical SAM superfamily enzyme YgiQ (UPF0313 family) [Desulfosalsimonas propionicica]